VIANPKQVRIIAHAKIKTETIDAGVLAQLYASGFLPEVWITDQPTQALRRQVTRRNQIVRQPAELAIERHMREFDRLGEDFKVIERDLACSALADERIARHSRHRYGRRAGALGGCRRGPALREACYLDLNPSVRRITELTRNARSVLTFGQASGAGWQQFPRSMRNRCNRATS
jgi:transposase